MSYRIIELLADHRAILAAAFGAGIAVMGAAAIAAEALPAYLFAFPNFAPDVTPQLPGDVDIALKERLENASKFIFVQREFDLNAWQMFLALNWPTNDQGQPAPRLEDTSFGPPRWTLWHNSSTIFQVGGATPPACGQPAAIRQLAPTRNLALPVSRGLPAFRVEANAAANAVENQRATRFLGVMSAVGELNAANLGDIQQAFTGPLIDQNGNFVFYEIIIDPNEVAYLCDHKLYNINGQVAFTTGGGKVDMPIGTPNQDASGSFELKLAWKVLEPCKDDPSRFFAEDAWIMDQGPDGKPHQLKVKVGLVGMHVGHKSETSPQWIWATFEQVDNLDVDPVAHPDLHPSFYDPNCPICAANVLPQKSAKGVYPRIPVQASRAIPIPGDKVHLNAEVAAALQRSKSVWQYYQLIDTQWPTVPKSTPATWDSGLAQAVTNKPSGQPTPVFLTNITMETYFQSGNQPACNQEEAVKTPCPLAYAASPPGTAIPAYIPDPVTWNSRLNAGKDPVKPGISTQIFATESCMGCHSSAGIWNNYDPSKDRKDQPSGYRSGQLSGDFSWLLTQKADWARSQ
jgi:hypothetical protein